MISMRYDATILTVLLACWSFQALAIPVPGGPSPANDLIINFDYTSPTAIAPPPTYANIETLLFFTPPFTGGTLALDIFGGLNGNNFIRSVVRSPNFVVIDTLGDSGLLDGVFSLGLRTTSGTADFTIASSFAIKVLCDTAVPPHCDTVQTPNVDGTLVSSPSAVPEPGSLALFGIAAGGFAFFRRKRKTA